jgi:hypothetical protein
VAATVVWPRRRGERRESPRRESCSPMYSQSAGIKRRRARAPGGAHAGEPLDTRQGPAAAALGLGRWSRPCQVSHGGGERHKLVPDPYYYESKKKILLRVQDVDTMGTGMDDLGHRDGVGSVEHGHGNRDLSYCRVRPCAFFLPLSLIPSKTTDPFPNVGGNPRNCDGGDDVEGVGRR